MRKPLCSPVGWLSSASAWTASPAAANDTSKKLNELARKIVDILAQEGQSAVPSMLQ